MKKRILLYYYAFVSLLFTAQSIIYVTEPGDQEWFARQAKLYSFIEFAFHRYQTWSSRLLIESVTMFMASHYLIFILSLFLSLIAFFYCLNNLFLKDEMYWKLKFITPILFFILLPSVLFTSAGLVATVTNYLFPMIALTIAWYFIESDFNYHLFLSIPFLSFASMQEQFAIFAFLFFAVLLLRAYLANKRGAFISYLLACLIATAGIFSAIVAPGSKIRLSEEITTWYPDFNELTFFDKVTNGFFETNRILFVNTDLNITYLLLGSLILLSFLKRKYLISLFSGLFLSLILLNRLGIATPLSSLQKIIDFRQQKFYGKGMIQQTILIAYPWFIYLLLLLLLACAISVLLKSKKEKIEALTLLVAGYASRMTVSFSPTIYASGLRTYLPLVFSVFLLLIFFLREGKVLRKWNTSKLQKNSTSYIKE